MEIRKLQISELDNLLALYEHMHVSDDLLPTRSRVQSVWQEIHDSPHFTYFGVFIDNKLVSSCAITIVPNLSKGCRPYGLIENVVTHADCRRKGYGTAVLKHALQYAWSQNCYKTMLLTGRKSEAVYRFYESVGFDKNAKQGFVAKPCDRHTSSA